jgi:ElaA protein
MTTPSPFELTWSWPPYAALSVDDLYQVLRLRQEVFVLEQRCFYQDLDGIDDRCWHGIGRLRDGSLVAYARIVPAGIKFAGPSIGRVVTAPSARRRGVGSELMARALAETRGHFAGANIHIAAQAHLQDFYRRFGFTAVGAPYDEDGIMHVDMIAPPAP